MDALDKFVKQDAGGVNVKITTYEEACGVKAKDRNPLERFVANNEPAGILDCESFRKELSELVEWVASQPNKSTGQEKECTCIGTRSFAGGQCDKCGRAIPACR